MQEVSEVFQPGIFSFLMKESKNRRSKQPGKFMAKSRSQGVNFPGAWPLMNTLPGWLKPNEKSWIMHFPMIQFLIILVTAMPITDLGCDKHGYFKNIDRIFS